MKKVFSSHAEVCHVWAQQTQGEGRSNSIFFEGAKIYSYGYHYLMAQIFTTPKGRCVVLNSNPYSNSTSKHRYAVLDAVRGLDMPVFTLPDTLQLKTKINIEYVKNSVNSAVEGTLQKIKITSQENIKWEWERINEVLKDANSYLRFIGLKEIEIPKNKIAEIDTHLKKRLLRFKELNTPEMIEKRETARRKREVLKTAKIEKQLQDKVQSFREGKEISTLLRNLRFDLLRKEGATLTTSRGAKVPYREAKLLYNAMLKGKDIVGRHIGPFTINALKESPDGGLLEIGCHRVKIEEVASVLS